MFIDLCKSSNIRGIERHKLNSKEILYSTDSIHSARRESSYFISRGCKERSICNAHNKIKIMEEITNRY